MPEKLGKLVAPCGFDCSGCPVYKVTQSGDDEVKKRVAEKWSKTVGKPVTVKETECDGCVAGGRLVAYCAECTIRSCAVIKSYPTCAHCPEMLNCDRITQRKTREMLAELKKKLGI